MEIFWTNQCQPFLMVSMTQVQGAQSTAATDLSIIKGKCIQVLLTFLECQMSQTLLPNSNRSSSPIPKELLSPVIPLHKRTPCISCLENAGWHLSTVRNGSPCKQCLYCLQSSRSYRAQTGKVHQPLCRQDINKSAFFVCYCAQFCDVSHANSSCTIRPSVSCRNRSSGCIWVDDSVDLVHLVHLVHLHTALLRRFTASPRPGKPGKCTSHLEDVTTVTTVTPFVKFYSRALS